MTHLATFIFSIPGLSKLNSGWTTEFENKIGHILLIGWQHISGQDEQMLIIPYDNINCGENCSAEKLHFYN